MDRERSAVVVGDQLTDAAHGRAPHGQDAAGQRGADRGSVGLVGAQQPALLEVEHIRGALEGEVILKRPREAQHGRHRPAGGEGVCAGRDTPRGEGQVCDFSWAKITCVADIPPLAHHPDAGDRIVGGIVRAVGYRPRAQNAGCGERGRLGNGDAAVVPKLAEIGAAEVEGGARVAHQGGKSKLCGSVGAACTPV